MVPIIKYRKLYYIFSGTLIITSIAALVFWGLRLGIDFKGGSLLFGGFTKEAMPQGELLSALKPLELGEVIAQPSGKTDVLLRFKEIDENKHQELLAELKKAAAARLPENDFQEKSFDSVGPSIGRELQSNAIKSIALVLVLIVAYIAFAFRKVSHPIASWKYGAAALIALFHDVIIPLGLFAMLGHYYSVEISSGFIAAILTVLGYSVHDSIIVFDRIRENLTKHRGKPFHETVDMSVNQTFTRSLNTSLTVILVLLAIYFLGGESVRYIALVLMAGVGVGTYSSIFIGSTLLVSWHESAGRLTK